jgi:uncharacterized protein YlxW (UPF0749 family)
MLERTLFPVAGCAAVAAALLACVYLFFTLKRAMDAWRRESVRERDRLAEELRALQARLSELEAEVAAAAAAKGSLQPPRSINITKRTQALRMVRRGETPERIAAALAMSRREVQLLLKVQKLIAEAPPKVTA